MTVDLMDGNWQAVAFGSAGLAGQLDTLEKSLLLPEDDSNKLVRIYQAKADFIVLSGGSGRHRVSPGHGTKANS
jgi:hypothetical protein